MSDGVMVCFFFIYIYFHKTSSEFYLSLLSIVVFKTDIIFNVNLIQSCCVIFFGMPLRITNMA